MAFLYHQRAANASRDPVRLSPAPSLTKTTRLLVFAPHCDDESLGCAGMIQQTLAAGGTAQTIMLTNGDGFRTAVERQARRLRIGPNDYIRFAAQRQEESYNALAQLGLRRENVLFFGYPDRGLMPLWNAYWTPDRLYTSAYTRCDHSPYANTFDPTSRYCGSNLLEDIKTALRAFRPTDVLVTHPADDHPDHAAAAAFVARAIQEIQQEAYDEGWERAIRLRYYLIHRGDWPNPQGSHPTQPLLPPTEMAYLDTRWTTLPLRPQEVTRKEQSIRLYPTQTALMGRFLGSFARNSELFGEVPPSRLMTVAENGIRLDAKTQDWETFPPILLDPVRDNMLRDLQGSGDIRAVYACRDSRRLYLRLDTRQPLSRRLTYTARLRAFGPCGESAQEACAIRLRASSSASEPEEETRCFSQGRVLEASIPWYTLSKGLGGSPVTTLAVSIETTLAGVEIDKTGIRFLNL